MSYRSIATAPGLRWEYAAPSLAALAYPFLLQGYTAGVNAGHDWRAWMQLGLAFGVALVGLVASVRLAGPGHQDAKTVAARRLAWLSVAAAPLYTATGVLLTMAGDPVADTTVWLVFWIAAPVLGLAAGKAQGAVASAIAPRLRVAHGISALAIVVLFLAMHLFSHLASLAGEAQQRHFMELFRRVYRATAVEPLIVLLFLFQVASGLQMVRILSTRPADAWRTLHSVTGVYLVFFILAHMNSVFIYARHYAQIPTDWGFATGAPAGLLHDPWNIRLVPHYALGVFSALAHLLLGARLVMLAHGIPASRVEPWIKAGIVAAAIAALAILAGMCGVHLPGSATLKGWL